MKTHECQLADLTLLLFVKVMQKKDDLYKLSANSVSTIISGEYNGIECTEDQLQSIAIIDPDREKMLQYIEDLFRHRLLYAQEFDDIYVALNLNLCGEMKVFQ